MQGPIVGEMTPYEKELSKIGDTLVTASEADIDALKAAISSASEDSILAIGSGGSYTVASLICSLHEKYTGRVSRAVTPLELICNPTLASNSPIFIVSAEGKNPDVLEALTRARHRSSRTVHVLTNRQQSPLMESVGVLNDVTPHVFSLIEKDGYLATNSLVLDSALIARAYAELDDKDDFVAPDPKNIELKDGSLREVLAAASDFVREAVSRRGLIIVYSPKLEPIARDLESKFSESALLFTQLADFRSFAHGRHLWLTSRIADSAVVVLSEPTTEALWEDMCSRLPEGVPIFALSLIDAKPSDLIAGLIAVMELVSLIANEAQKDIARPDISELGRSLYYADLGSLIASPQRIEDLGLGKKFDVLGAHWPSSRRSGVVMRAQKTLLNSLKDQRFRAVVFDYDGTLCSSNRRNTNPPDKIVEHIHTLCNAGIIVGVASGRGDSVIEHFEDFLDPSLWELVRLGLYNGGWIGRLGERPSHGTNLSEFLIHAQRIVSKLQSSGVPIAKIRPTPPYQLSVRFAHGVNTEAMWFVVVDAFMQAGLATATIQRSKHSIDILSRGVSKSHLVESIVKEDKIDPYEIVTMGDLGAWPGNDFSLLQHAFSLSVDLPSRRLDRGWNFAPKDLRDVDATLWYLDNLELLNDGYFQFKLPVIGE